MGVMWTRSPSRTLTLPAVPATRPRLCISRAAATTSARSDTRNRFLVRRLEHTRLGEDSRDQLCRGDVEGGVERLGTGADLRGVALLYGNLDAASLAGIDRRDGRGHVERHAVAGGGHRERVGADLVGPGAGCRGPVGAP